MSPHRILLTGFEPFGGEVDNPSARILEALAGWGRSGVEMQTLLLPCAFGQAPDALEAHLTHWPADTVLALGQAGGRADICVERVAINVDDARIPDNLGRQPIDQPIVPGAPAAFFSTLPIKTLVATLQAQGLPAGVSQTAGTFVCNHLFYRLMHWAAARPSVRAGFVHVPWLPEQAAKRTAQPSMALATQIEAVALMLNVLVDHPVHEVDQRISGGAEH